MPRKVVVIGAGFVGCSYIYAMLQKGVASEIVLVDVDEKRVKGEVMDLNHGLCFAPPATVRGGTYADCAGADLIVITAGSRQKPGESRLNLVQRNAKIVECICDDIAKHTSNSVVLMVSNPVDVLTRVAIKRLNWSKGRVIGSGTVLDSARFRYMLGEHCKVDTRSIHGYILGEHGDSEIAAWSLCTVGGQSIKDNCPVCQGRDTAAHQKILEEVRNSAYSIIENKGSTYYGIGLSLLRITEAILRDEKSVLAVSTLLDGEYGIKDVCLSLPCVVGHSGVTSILTPALDEEEKAGLERSAEALRASIASL